MQLEEMQIPCGAGEGCGFPTINGCSGPCGWVAHNYASSGREHLRAHTQHLGCGTWRLCYRLPVCPWAIHLTYPYLIFFWVKHKEYWYCFSASAGGSEDLKRCFICFGPCKSCRLTSVQTHVKHSTWWQAEIELCVCYGVVITKLCIILNGARNSLQFYFRSKGLCLRQHG